MKKKTRVLIISYTAALVAALAVGLIACRTDADRRQTAMDANYRHAYGEVLNAVQELDGKCCFARADDASMDAYLEIGYHMGADAQTLAGSLLNDYGTIASMETLGEVKLGGLTAYGAKGVTVQRELEAYLIPTANGCISVVLCHAGTAPVSWYDSLLASAQTLQITG